MKILIIIDLKELTEIIETLIKISIEGLFNFDDSFYRINSPLKIVKTQEIS
jgi:hypothetical protein